MPQLVLVQWRQFGVYLEDGRAFPRQKGEEDLMPRVLAEGYVAAGHVRIVATITPNGVADR